MSKLSTKHNAFINLYTTNGYNGTSAYMNIYPKSNEKSAAVSACELLKKPNIIAEIKIRQDDQRKIIEEKSQVSKEIILKNLVYIMEKQIDTFPPSSLKAMEVINKMLGFNEPDKIEIKNDVDLNIPGVTDNTDIDEQ